MKLELTGKFLGMIQHGDNQSAPAVPFANAEDTTLPKDDGQSLLG
jgi:hypothetical protein